MKKISFISILLAFLFFSCNGTSGSNDPKSPAGASVARADGGDDQPAGKVLKPVHLTKETFKEKVMDYEKNPTQWVYAGDKPAIIDFYADWCKPCRMIAPIMEELAAEYEGQITIYKIDTEAERELASVFGITSLPTVLFVPMSGNPSAQRGAMSKESYKQIIDEFLLKKGTRTN